jgi:ubiquinone/menaquinone biosynthesis C-methylase UbiE
MGMAPSGIAQVGEDQRDHKASLSSFASQDIAKRLRKVSPIVEALRQHSRPLGESPALLLDLGAGSGIIGQAVAEKLDVDCVEVDVSDERTCKQTPFVIASCEMLPFLSGTFDFVICNHIIEHVFAQGHFIKEVQRVLKPEGLCYLATPNKYALLEPHYKLPFLSWLPKNLADGWVRLAKRGQSYDVQPVTRHDVQNLASSAGLQATELTLDMISSPRRYRRKGLWSNLAGSVPSFITRQLLVLAPSYVWLLEPKK